MGRPLDLCVTGFVSEIVARHLELEVHGELAGAGVSDRSFASAAGTSELGVASALGRYSSGNPGNIGCELIVMAEEKAVIRGARVWTGTG
jgi:hypothetical protein